MSNKLKNIFGSRDYSEENVKNLVSNNPKYDLDDCINGNLNNINDYKDQDDISNLYGINDGLLKGFQNKKKFVEQDLPEFEKQINYLNDNINSDDGVGKHSEYFANLNRNINAFVDENSEPKYSNVDENELNGNYKLKNNYRNKFERCQDILKLAGNQWNFIVKRSEELGNINKRLNNNSSYYVDPYSNKLVQEEMEQGEKIIKHNKSLAGEAEFISNNAEGIFNVFGSNDFNNNYQSRIAINNNNQKANARRTNMKNTNANNKNNPFVVAGKNVFKKQQHGNKKEWTKCPAYNQEIKGTGNKKKEQKKFLGLPWY